MMDKLTARDLECKVEEALDVIEALSKIVGKGLIDDDLIVKAFESLDITNLGLRITYLIRAQKEAIEEVTEFLSSEGFELDQFPKLERVQKDKIWW